FEALGLVVAGYAALILIWPWPPSRFLVPLAPLLVGLGLDGAVRAARRLNAMTRPPPAAATLTAAGLVACNLVALGRFADDSARTGFPHVCLDDAPVSWSSYEQVFSWLRANSSPGDTIACGLDSMVYLYTDRPAFRPFVHRPLVM